MPKPIPPPQYETSESRQWVAHQLGLSYHDRMQDWSWEVAKAEDLDAYFQLYAQAEDAERLVLLEMILEAASNDATPAQMHTTWPRIEALLTQRADLHATTAQYWCVWDIEEQDVEEKGFPISPYIRAWWRAHFVLPAARAM
ncbi:hypothetical protein [Hymenobacter sp. AT01-02]|uniref:hypothetical protein n=1 Tax=Hymenobacter sp. AT01-02 TaxID=1571877 RepID=UPI000A7FC73F|nr:hypothetical protein [Hymenobacter sp. AT01-02]